MIIIVVVLFHGESAARSRLRMDAAKLRREMPGRQVLRREIVGRLFKDCVDANASANASGSDSGNDGHLERPDR